MQKYNKATVSVIGGAIVTIAATVLPDMGQEVWQAIQTLVVAALVWLIPNRG